MNPGLRLLLVASAFAGFLAATTGSGDDGDDGAAAPVVVVRRGDALRTFTAEQAAERIAELEAQLAARPRGRAVRAVEDTDDDEETAPPPPATEPPVVAPKKPDGTFYTAAELRDLALSADTDPVLRRAAIRSLRNDDTPEARAALATILRDSATPADLRLEAAKALTRPPHRDAAPDELVAALQWVNEFPRSERGPLLDAARADTDPWVRISAYARSPAPIVRRDRDAVLAALDAADPRVRDSAYRVISQTWGIDVTYRAGWNARARDRASAAIREAVASEVQR